MNCQNELDSHLRYASINQTKLNVIKDSRFVDNSEWQMVGYSYNITQIGFDKKVFLIKNHLMDTLKPT